ncbi:MAG: superoxide dismutase [Planctomyces sp.]|nr:superoxide dismutase [Planctomyces sp.]
MFVLLLIACNQSSEMNASMEDDNAPTDDVVAVNDDAEESESVTAVAELVAIGESGVTGSVKFVDMGDEVRVTGKVTGLTPGKHGFHVHEKGDLSDKETGKSAGGHFNPTDEPHGRPSDEERHIGDLGNIEANEDGVATIDMTDSVICLEGEHSIVGRALMIHQGEDQFTQPSGDAGDRVAFGKIEVADE